MAPLHEIYEYEFLSGNRLATVFKLDKGVKIIGFIYGRCFEIKVLTIGNNPRRKGLGKKALEFLRPKFSKIVVTEICEEALPFWLKMRERRLVDELKTMKDGKSLYLIKKTTKLGNVS